MDEVSMRLHKCKMKISGIRERDVSFTGSASKAHVLSLLPRSNVCLGCQLFFYGFFFFLTVKCNMVNTSNFKYWYTIQLAIIKCPKALGHHQHANILLVNFLGGSLVYNKVTT